MSRSVHHRPAFVAGAVALAVCGLIAGRTLAQSSAAPLPGKASGVGASDLAASLAGFPWRIVEVSGKRAPADARIVFTATTASGAAGCNRFYAPLVSDAGPRVGSIQSTLMTCAGRMDGERDVFSALSRMRTASRSGDTLELRDEDGAAVLRLTR